MTLMRSSVAERERPAGGESERARRLPFWLARFLNAVRSIETGRIDITLPDGRLFHGEGANPGPHGVLTVTNWAFFSRLVRDGETGFGEMYVDGWWTTPDLQQLLDVIMLNDDAVEQRFPGAALIRAVERLRHLFRANSLRGARRNIARHYDLGNEFYRAWLDTTMTYSSGLFLNGRENLEDAQRNKYAAIAKCADLGPGDRLLEVGCGWGGFAEFAARFHDTTTTAITISRAQRDYARRRLFEAGLAERVSVLLCDYRDIEGQFDRIVSIEMLEAVGERYWPAYFGALRDRLRSGGRIALQTITVSDRYFPDYRRNTDFIRKHIFPGGMLPSPAALRRETDRAGLAIETKDSLADSYSQTLRCWRERFNAAWDDIAPMGFDSRFHRMWNYYLASCASCFAGRSTDVFQIGLRHADACGVQNPLALEAMHSSDRQEFRVEAEKMARPACLQTDVL